MKLSEEPIDIQASYDIEGPPRLQLYESSLQSDSKNNTIPSDRVRVAGRVFGFNTTESFQKVDKNKLLRDFLCPKFLDATTAEDLSCLNSAILLTFADLKDHKVVYWFGIPALKTNADRPIQALQQDDLKSVWSEEARITLVQNLNQLRRSILDAGGTGLPPFFLCTETECAPLTKSNYLSSLSKNDNAEVVFGFFDPVGPAPIQAEQPMGWPMRNLIAYLCFHLDLGGTTVQILSFRPKRVRRLPEDERKGHLPSIEDADDSLFVHVVVPTKEDYGWKLDCDGNSLTSVGWELNARSKLGPRLVDLRPLMDSTHLAIQAADLNLKLMKWRMIPNLNTSLLQSTKVLLLGAGTLGCSVARVLLGWGVRDITIVDYGKVSYSNPVRQALFTLDDCRDEGGSGKPKAVAAAVALKTIAADVQSKGIILSIPMPGHSESRDSIETSVNELDHLIQSSDVIFLLTDTRESRWLPTVMAAAHDKILINAALGLDSWLVMRHGGGPERSPRLGCYFCNDVVAPENSTKNRTLDQQCTVTRPGLAPIASSMAVELMVALLHHPDRQSAPPPAGTSGTYSPTVATSDATSSGALGVMPHQIRGSLVSYTMMTPTVPAFRFCTGCSPTVVKAYQENKSELVYVTCQSTDSTQLENLAGLTAFRAEATEKLAGVDEDWEADE
jgi:ubiquitin-like modifier-activating enzyme ATG7